MSEREERVASGSPSTLAEARAALRRREPQHAQGLAPGSWSALGLAPPVGMGPGTAPALLGNAPAPAPAETTEGGGEDEMKGSYVVLSGSGTGKSILLEHLQHQCYPHPRS